MGRADAVAAVKLVEAACAVLGFWDKGGAGGSDFVLYTITGLSEYVLYTMLPCMMYQQSRVAVVNTNAMSTHSTTCMGIACSCLSRPVGRVDDRSGVSQSICAAATCRQAPPVTLVARLCW